MVNAMLDLERLVALLAALIQLLVAILDLLADE
jgi:hypothetical protein